MKKIFVLTLILSISGLISLQAQQPETLGSLAAQFEQPADTYKPHAWWHWLGTNFSKQGITRDLESMKSAGIGGVVVFNAPAWLDPQKTPFPENTYRSSAYWDALGHTLSEAKRLGMEVGIHNTAGWSTTGGPWISPEEDGMKAVAFDTIIIEGGKQISIELPLPKGDFYKDVAVLAMPDKQNVSIEEVLEITPYFKNGILNWNAPAGQWKIYRFGYYSTLQRSHPTPEDVEQTAFEADKMSPSATRKHWTNVLTPFKERFGKYIGTTFKYVWIDSYEAWGQSWTPEFREKFIQMKGYDPVPQIVLAFHRGDQILSGSSKGVRDIRSSFKPETKIFVADYREVVSRLFLECFRIGKEMANEAGFQLVWEPYGSIVAAPFDMEEGVGIADIPATEFWVHSSSLSNDANIAAAAAKYQKRVVGAEAFTGMEATCRFTETPAMLKRPADMGYNSGVNKYWLHSWAHNPLDDKYQPGWGFAHYGTHFSRNQTWIEPSKAFFTYLARCQMLLQQGSYLSRNDSVVHRQTPDAEIFFVRNTGAAQAKTIAFPVTQSVPELWDAYHGTIKTTSNYREENGKTLLTLNLEKDESVFVVFPLYQTTYAKESEKTFSKKSETVLNNKWNVTFVPKTGEKPFKRTFNTLTDWSLSNDDAIKYFSGTAIYETTFNFQFSIFNFQFLIDLGKVCDLAEVEINGKSVGVLWIAPFKADITKYLTAGKNSIKIKVTNTWVNRLIGDEQYPEDFEWKVRDNGQRAMTALPDWVLNDEPRPVKERKAFTPWYYYGKDSKLAPSGLLGPVKIINQEVE
jgi:hypothetical protein